MMSFNNDQLPKGSEIVVTLDDPRNRDYFFYPINEVIRSAFLAPRSGVRYPTALAAFATQAIPGERIHLDQAAKTARIVDGLGDPNCRSLFEEVNLAGSQLNPPKRFAEPRPPKVYANLSKDEIVTWMYWMRRIVDGDRIGVAKSGDPSGMNLVPMSFGRLVQGSLPSLVDLIKTGKVLMPQTDARARMSKYLPIPEVLREEMELAAAGAGEEKKK